MNPTFKSKKKVKILITAFVVLVILPIAFLIYDSSQRSSQLVPEQKIVTITYTGSEFMPQIVKITKGTKIVWVNEDSTKNTSLQITPNSSEEKVFSDFGGKTGVDLNGTYSYTFNATGTVYYKNSNQPMINGTIEIVDK